MKVGKNKKKLWWNSKSEILMVSGSHTKNLSEIGNKPFGIFLIFKKSSKGPLNQKKFFVSDSTQILCVKSLGQKDCIFWISSKSETKNFFISFGGFQIFNPISGKVWNDVMRQDRVNLTRIYSWPNVSFASLLCLYCIFWLCNLSGNKFW